MGMKFRTFVKGGAYYLDFLSWESLSFKRRMVELDWLRRRASLPDTSFAGETEAISKALLLTGRQDGGWCVDLAASDGVIQSSTLPLFRSGWKGLAIEMDGRRFSSLAFIYADFADVALARARVTPHNVGSLFEALRVPPNFDVFNLDIDSYDLAVLTALLESGFRPGIISMEINEKIPPPLHFSVLYSDSHFWRGDHFFGCSITAATHALAAQDYGLLLVAYNNAIFVDLSLVDSSFKSLTAEQAWTEGYLDRHDRTRLFPWNSNVEKALTLSPLEAKAFFDELFEPYKGQYELCLEDELSVRRRAAP